MGMHFILSAFFSTFIVMDTFLLQYLRGIEVMVQVHHTRNQYGEEFRQHFPGKQ